MSRRSRWAVILCAAVSAMPTGCVQSPRPLTADLFAPPSLVEPVHAEVIEHVSTTATSIGGQDAVASTRMAVPLQPLTGEVIQPLEALINLPRADLPPGTDLPRTDMRRTDLPRTDLPSTDSRSDLVKTAPDPTASDPAGAQTVSNTIRPGFDGSGSQTPSPALVPGTSTGVYMTVGGVIATVNGTPIYSGQIFRRLEKQFAARARDLTETEFRRFAAEEIDRQLAELENDERLFKMAYNQLDEKGRELAEQITIHIKKEKINAAGGSLEAAKRRAADEGQDFDEMMATTYREIVHDLYQQQMIEPMVQIGRGDLYSFYRQNLAKLYSEKSKALFRVIQMDPAELKDGNPDIALARITAIRERAAGGEDFIRLASSENTDTFLRGRGGDPGGWMEPNTYRLEDVEKAVWQLEPGQVTPVIKAEGAFYIAKLMEKKIGVVRSFDDPTVQEDIYTRVRQKLISERWSTSKDAFADEAVISVSEQGFQLAIDLAMQKYRIIQTANSADASAQKVSDAMAR